jgi:hypothetical protein
MRTIDSVYNRVESNYSSHLTKKLIHKFVTKTLCHNCLHNLSRCTLDPPLIADLLSLRFHRLHIFWFCFTHASNKIAFPEFSKRKPKEGFPTLSTESTSRKHKSSHVERLVSLRELAPFRLSLPQNHKILLFVLVFKIFLP